MPELSVTSASVNKNVTVQLSGLATQTSGNSIVYYEIADVSSTGGTLLINGQAVSLAQPLVLTALEFAQTQFAAGVGDEYPVPYPRQRRVEFGAMWADFDVAASPKIAPTVNVSNQTIPSNAAISLSSILTAHDPGGSVTTYQFYDNTSGNGSFVVNGVVQGAESTSR